MPLQSTSTTKIYFPLGPHSINLWPSFWTNLKISTKISVGVLHGTGSCCWSNNAFPRFPQLEVKVSWATDRAKVEARQSTTKRHFKVYIFLKLSDTNGMEYWQWTLFIHSLLPIRIQKRIHKISILFCHY